MNIRRSQIVLGCTLLLASCGVPAPSYFVPALNGNDISYLPRPMLSDSSRTGNYISGSLAGLTLPYSSGDLTMGQLNYNRAHTTKSLKLAYGGFVYAGAVKNSEFKPKNAIATPELDGRGFYGGGLRSSVGFFQLSGNTEFRILSWENALSFESGGYSTFRKKMNALNDPNVSSSTQTTLYTTGGSTEIIWHPKVNTHHHYAFRLFYGETIGMRSSLQKPDQEHIGNGAVDFSFYFKLTNLYGVISSGANRGGSSKISLGYAF